MKLLKKRFLIDKCMVLKRQGDKIHKPYTTFIFVLDEQTYERVL